MPSPEWKLRVAEGPVVRGRDDLGGHRPGAGERDPAADGPRGRGHRERGPARAAAPGEVGRGRAPGARRPPWTSASSPRPRSRWSAAACRRWWTEGTGWRARLPGIDGVRQDGHRPGGGQGAPREDSRPPSQSCPTAGSWPSRPRRGARIALAVLVEHAGSGGEGGGRRWPARSWPPSSASRAAAPRAWPASPTPKRSEARMPSTDGSSSTSTGCSWERALSWPRIGVATIHSATQSGRLRRLST